MTDWTETNHHYIPVLIILVADTRGDMGTQALSGAWQRDDDDSVPIST